MTVAYLDTSAAMKLVIEEAESEALVDALVATPDRVLAASWLLYTEMMCAAGRRPELITDDLVRQALDPVEFVDLNRGDYFAAARHAPLRSNDALHLAAALRLCADEFITYDAELASAAARDGLRVIAPGAHE